jgi:hypothetical protein
MGRRQRYGRIKRSETAKRELMRQTGYPRSMQWQTIAEAKAKDK